MSHPRRPRSSGSARALLGATVLVAVGLLGACGGTKPEPRDYGKDYESNFMFGCTGVESADGTTTVPNEKLASKSYCQCVYDGLSKKVPFDQVKSFEEKQADAATGDITVPKNIQAVFDSCESKR